jgi:hypothetical protein
MEIMTKFIAHDAQTVKEAYGCHFNFEGQFVDTFKCFENMDEMTLYCRHSFDSSDPTIPDIKLTREELLADYYEFWKSKMRQVSKEHMISEENCLQDWLTVNFGWKEEK